MLPDDVTIIIPVYNEAEYIADVLRSVLEFCPNILVVNDGSDDGSDTVLEKFKNDIDIIVHEHNQGYGQSLIDAFECTLKKGYKWVITMDCDHQHQPSCLPNFFEEIKSNVADIISGSRYLKEFSIDSGHVPNERVEINKEITSFLNAELGLCLTDSFCGFKAYRCSIFTQHFDLTEQGYGLPLQLWIQAAAADLVIKEIPVPLIYHDPSRNFSGELENPTFRMQYYLKTINTELERHAYKNASK